MKIKDQIEELKDLGVIDGQLRLMWKEGEACSGTSWTMSVAAITEDDIFDMDEDKPEVKSFMAQKSYDYMVVAQPKHSIRCIKNKEDIEVSLDDMAQIIGGKVKIVPYEEREIIKSFNQVPACLTEDPELAITLGRDLYEAYAAMTVLEKSAEVNHKAVSLGGIKGLTPGNIFYQRNKYLRKYSLLRKKQMLRQQVEKTGEVEEDLLNDDKLLGKEKLLRCELVMRGKELLADGLLQGTWGNLSARLDDVYMLVTPTGLSYGKLTPEDIVKVRIYDLEYDEAGNHPTSEVLLHSGIYMARSDVNAVVHVHSREASIFSACRMPFEIPGTENLPEELIRCTAYARAGSAKLADNAVEELKDRSGVILSNHGMVSVGESLSIAVDNAYRIEEAAKKRIDAIREGLDSEVYFL